jgi:hypothetical protein
MTAMLCGLAVIHPPRLLDVLLSLDKETFKHHKSQFNDLLQEEFHIQKAGWYSADETIKKARRSEGVGSSGMLSRHPCMTRHKKHAPCSGLVGEGKIKEVEWRKATRERGRGERFPDCVDAAQHRFLLEGNMRATSLSITKFYPPETNTSNWERNKKGREGARP